jgi:hypothetical protein
MSQKFELASRYRILATETVTVASGTKSPKDRVSLLKLADEYVRMARELEAEAQTERILQQIDDSPRIAHTMP